MSQQRHTETINVHLKKEDENQLVSESVAKHLEIRLENFREEIGKKQRIAIDKINRRLVAEIDHRDALLKQTEQDLVNIKEDWDRQSVSLENKLRSHLEDSIREGIKELKNNLENELTIQRECFEPKVEDKCSIDQKNIEAKAMEQNVTGLHFQETISKVVKDTITVTLQQQIDSLLANIKNTIQPTKCQAVSTEAEDEDNGCCRASKSKLGRCKSMPDLSQKDLQYDLEHFGGETQHIPSKASKQQCFDSSQIEQGAFDEGFIPNSWLTHKSAQCYLADAIHSFARDQKRLIRRKRYEMQLRLSLRLLLVS